MHLKVVSLSKVCVFLHYDCWVSLGGAFNFIKFNFVKLMWGQCYAWMDSKQGKYMGGVEVQWKSDKIQKI